MRLQRSVTETRQTDALSVRRGVQKTEFARNQPGTGRAEPGRGCILVPFEAPDSHATTPARTKPAQYRDTPMADGPKLILDDDWKKKPEQPAAAASSPGPSGMQVDSDWKSQASAERDRLAAEEEKKKAAGGAGGRPGQGPQQMPAAEFLELVRMLTTQALMYLGAFPDPESGRPILAPEMAKFQIDMLGMLEAKTKGNLTPEEKEELEGVIRELRLQFAQVMKAVEKMMAERAAKGLPLTGPITIGGPAPSGGAGGAGPGLKLSGLD